VSRRVLPPRKVSQEELQEQADEIDYLTPREYAQLRGIAPQLVYYYIRNGIISDERCRCGRTVVCVSTSDKAIQTRKGARGQNVDTRSDADRLRDHVQGLP
jgi:hypothetical protein